jgi:hypothetical protein
MTVSFLAGGRIIRLARRGGGLPDLADDYLDHAGEGYGDQCGDETAEQAADPVAERCADQDGYQDEQRIDPDRLAHDDRVQGMIFDLGVGEENDERDDSGSERVPGREQHRWYAGQRAPDQGEEIDQRYPERPEEGEGNAGDEQRDEHHHTRDNRCDQVT